MRWQLVTGQSGQRDEVGRRTRVDEERVLYPEEGGKLRLERSPLRAEREPEVERCAHGGLDFVLIEDSARIRHGRPARLEGDSFLGTGAIRPVHRRGVFAGQPENLGFEFGGRWHGA